MFTITATVHHGDYRASATAEIDDYKASEDDMVRQICAALTVWRDHERTPGFGAYVPAPGLVWHQIARQIIHTGEATHGWVRFTTDEL